MTLLLALTSAPALAADAPPVLIWLEQDLPEDKAARKALRVLAPDAVAYSSRDLAFPPQPASKKDDKAYAELGRALERSRDRWDEFDVELSIADELETAVSAVDLIRSEEDREALLQASVLVGSAVHMAFTADDLATSEQAEPYRLEVPGGTVNRAMLDVLALDASRNFTRSEVGNGGAFDLLEELRAGAGDIAPGTLDTSALPRDARLMVNGRAVEAPGDELSLPAGHYWLHLERDGAAWGRTQVDIRPATGTDLPLLVDETERAEAERLILEGSVEGLPDDVVAAVTALGAWHAGSDIFLAALDEEGKVEVVPYSKGAELIKREVVTFLLGAEVGGGGVGTAAFRFAQDDGKVNDTSMLLAPAAVGSFDLEFGIYNLALLGGAEVHITPTESLLYGTGEPGATSASNRASPVYVKPSGGLGVYAIRPSDYRRATLMLGGTYGWFSPGHLGYGGRLTVGIPMGVGNWFKLSLSGFYGDPMQGFPPDRPVVAGNLRIGFQTKL
jgi:hypothetical protein